MQFNAIGIITANANFNKFLVLIKVTELFKGAQPQTTWQKTEQEV